MNFINFDANLVMDIEEVNQDILKNSFFTRGCCKTPGTFNPEKAFKSGCAKLDCHDWLQDLKPAFDKDPAYVEVRFKNSKKDFLHMLNGTAVATSRALIVILENYQDQDGSIRI